MTKKEMIKYLQELEKKEWEKLKTYSITYGKNDILTEKQKSKWAIVNDILENLEISELPTEITIDID